MNESSYLTKNDILTEKIVKDAIARLNNAAFSPSLNFSGFRIKTDDSKSEEQAKLTDKWIWVEGYKGMTKDMQGHGNYQFEIGKRYDMPTDVEIKACYAGFHLSLNLEDTFIYYPIRNDNRFFKVRALVRERDLNEYRRNTEYPIGNKLASQSIEIIRELTVDEVFEAAGYADWSNEYKLLAMSEGLNKVKQKVEEDELVKLGYSRPFAAYVVDKGRVSTAKAVGSQTDLSMDMKALMIMNW
jgi:hypothetical protein